MGCLMIGVSVVAVLSERIVVVQVVFYRVRCNRQGEGASIVNKFSVR